MYEYLVQLNEDISFQMFDEWYLSLILHLGNQEFGKNAPSIAVFTFVFSSKAIPVASTTAIDTTLKFSNSFNSSGDLFVSLLRTILSG